jgi:phosphopantetheinyl transferase (holo-ACP synthase)
MNEMLKEHRLVQELKATTEKQAARIALQDAQIKALTAGLQKVSAQLEVMKSAPQIVQNSR